MRNEFEKRYIADLSQKLEHLEGVLGAYLPKHVFDSEVQQRMIDCTKFAYSRLRSGQRKAANWELARFIELFELAREGFDYRLFFQPLDQFNADLEKAGVGSYGSTAGHRLREVLRKEVAPNANILVRRDGPLNVGGIGGRKDDSGIICLQPRDNVTLTIPLRPETGDEDCIFLLHDFPTDRATSCLMPSEFAPDPKVPDRNVRGKSIRLPQNQSGHLSFPVAGKGGYRCLYGIQSSSDLLSYVGLENAHEGVVDIENHQIAKLVDFLVNTTANQRSQTYVSFGEYLLN